MKLNALSIVALAALAATPAAAQVSSGRSDEGPGNSRRDVLGFPSDVGILASTPSRIPRSRREMNRGRASPFELRMSPREARNYADDLIERAALRCEVAEALLVARTGDNIPVVEVDCVEGGGLVIADTLPIQATDCLDFVLADATRPEDEPLLTCQLPANVASVAAARQSARN